MPSSTGLGTTPVSSMATNTVGLPSTWTSAERGTASRDSVPRPVTVPVVGSAALSAPSTTVSFAFPRASTSTVPEYGS